MKTVLMVAEKPSLAQSIAKILSNGSSSSYKGKQHILKRLEPHFLHHFLTHCKHFKMKEINASLGVWIPIQIKSSWLIFNLNLISISICAN